MFVGKFISDCFSDQNVEGFRSTFYCPKVKRLSARRLPFLLESEVIAVDIFGWFERLERGYDYTKPPSVLMSLLEKDLIPGLETESWLLEAILSARDIHPEGEKFQL